MIITQAKTTVRNQLFSDVLEHLKLPIPCDLSMYPMEIRGTIQDHGRGHFDICILGCLSQPFHGPHLVSIGYNSHPFWVQSLTCFRKNFFGFTDRLSFERSIFIKFPNSLIRLKNIRFIVTLPQFTIPENTPIFKNPETYTLYRPPSPPPTSPTDVSAIPSSSANEVQQRLHDLVRQCVEKLLSAYIRQYPSRLQCVQKLNDDFTSQCAQIAQNMHSSSSSDEPLEGEEDDNHAQTDVEVDMTTPEWEAFLNQVLRTAPTEEL